MGVLDDAIREHLDLKRRRGADPTEIERDEREALGPVRRGPEPVDSNDLPAEPGDEFEPGAQPEWEAEAYEEPTAFHAPAPGAGQDSEPGAEGSVLPAAEPEPFDVPLPRDEPDAYRHPLPDEPDPLEDESAHPAPHAAPGSPPPAGEETIEYSVEEAKGEKGEKDDDVLEETPEFLQDAPEHDRLWFEQRPPRDFDFNE